MFMLKLKLKGTRTLLWCSNGLSLNAAGASLKASALSSWTQHHHYRPYAMSSDGYSSDDHGKLRWPEVTPANAVPNPYQIFNQKKGAPYSKRRFYELVKLYHPDRHHTDSTVAALPYEIKLERYRLIVAANNILADPVRRAAYDRYGAGWNGMPNAAQPGCASEDANSAGGRGWSGGPNGPSQNATWEDWEKWYARDGPQEPRYVSNAAFVGLVLAFAVLGGIGQATRVGNYTMTFTEQRDAFHDAISKILVYNKKKAYISNNREKQVVGFLINRDPIGYGTSDAKEEVLKKLLSDPDICSGHIPKEQHIGIHHQTDNPKDG